MSERETIFRISTALTPQERDELNRLVAKICGSYWLQDRKAEGRDKQVMHLPFTICTVWR
jgi:hypothetical protein